MLRFHLKLALNEYRVLSLGSFEFKYKQYANALDQLTPRYTVGQDKYLRLPIKDLKEGCIPRMYMKMTFGDKFFIYKIM